MEGVGPRLGRASSRYGPATVFNGPVRKWKKKWVHVSSSNVTYQHSQSLSNGHNNNGSSRLLLCRWTPISPSNGTGDGENSSGSTEEPPRRKFRYTPIATLGNRRKEVAVKVDNEAKTTETDQSTAWLSSMSDGPDGIHGKSSTIDFSMKDTQASNKNIFSPRDSSARHLDLGLCLTGHDDNHDREGQLERVSSGGFWPMG